MHAYAVSLHNSRRTIAVNYQAWEVVTFAMNQSIRIIIRIICHTNAFSHGQSRLHTLLPKTVVNSNIVKTQHPYSDSSQLIMSYRNTISISRYHPYSVTFSDTFVHVMNGARKHPWVKTL